MGIYISFVVWIILISFAPANSLLNNNQTNRIVFSLFISYITFLFIKSINIFIFSEWKIPDTVVYTRNYYNMKEFSLTQAFEQVNAEPFYILSTWIIARFTETHLSYYLVIWISISVLLYYTLKNFFEKQYIVIVYFSFINFPFFFPYIVNGLRQGIAMFLILFAISMIYKNTSKKLFLICILISSILFHYTAAPFAVILLFLNKYKVNIKVSLLSWLFFALLYVTDLNSFIFGKLNSSYIEAYTSVQAFVRFTGINRIDFLLFSFLWILFSMIFIKKSSDKQVMLINCYIFFNIIFLVFGFIGFSNRISAYSWFLIPILVWMPILNLSKNKNIFIGFIIIVFILCGVFTGSLIYIGF